MNSKNSHDIFEIKKVNDNIKDDITEIFYPTYKQIKYDLEQFWIESKQEMLESSIN